MIESNRKGRMNLPHELPDETEDKSLGSIDDIRTLDPDHVHSILLRKIDSVIAILDLLES